MPITKEIVLGPDQPSGSLPNVDNIDLTPLVDIGKITEYYDNLWLEPAKLTDLDRLSADMIAISSRMVSAAPVLARVDNIVRQLESTRSFWFDEYFSQRRKEFDELHAQQFALYKQDGKKHFKPDRRTDMAIRSEAELLVVKTGIDQLLSSAKSLKKYVESVYSNSVEWLNVMKKHYDRMAREKFGTII